MPVITDDDSSGVPMRHVTIALLSALCVSGCAATGVPLAPAPIAAEGTVRPAFATVALKGVALAPASIVSSNAGTLVGNNAAGLISDKAASLSAPAYALLAVDALAPVADADVVVSDSAGRPLTGLKPVKTDASGGFTVEGVPQGMVCVVEVKAASFRLTTVATGLKGAAAFEVSPATTVVTEHLKANLATMPGAIAHVKPADFDKLSDEVARAIDADGLAVDLKPDGHAADVLALVATKDGGIGQEVKAIVQAANDARKAEKDKEKASPQAANPDQPGDATPPAPDPAGDPPGDSAPSPAPGQGGDHANEHAGGHAAGDKGR
jgi:hypothetical protein